jgi:hypothetical protein
MRVVRLPPASVRTQAAEPAQQRDRSFDDHRFTPRPEPCSVPRRAMCRVICKARTWSRRVS